MLVPIDSPAELGRVVRGICKSQGLSQRKLAAQLGVGQRWLHELEVGRPKRIDEHYVAVLAAIGVRLVAEVDDGVV